MSYLIPVVQVYYHGETIPVTVKVKNDTNKVVNKIKITGERYTHAHTRTHTYIHTHVSTHEYTQSQVKFFYLKHLLIFLNE